MDALSHYQIVEQLGAGGMGIVFRAVDTRLNRTVALKVVAPEIMADASRRERFVKEARAAAAFNHPNIVTIYEVDTASGHDFIVMELVSGKSLARTMRSDGLPIDDVLAYAEQIAAALEAAHAANIVHRDIKPANVMVTESGQVKLLDFGIAKDLVPDAPDAGTMTAADATRAGVVIGSLGYMAPEQAQGHAVDGRTDVFSFGIVLYEMLTGRRPFVGATPLETLAKLLEGRPEKIEAFRKDVPRQLMSIVEECLRKDRTQRPSASDVHRRLGALRETRSASAGGLGLLLRQRTIVLPLVLAIVVLLGLAGIWRNSGREVREARNRLPEISKLAEQYDYDGFYRAARTVVALLPDDLHLKNEWINLTMPATFDSVPSDAEVWVKGYSATDADWIPLGRTPMQQVRVPLGQVRLKLEKSGYAPFQGSLNPFSYTYTLDPLASVPEGMTRVPANAISLYGTTFKVPAFWIDKFEVTNGQFKTFIDAGGYRRREFWKEAFVEDGRSVEWTDAMARFRDRTGRPGPVTWELGTYPDGQADFPVSGVSWYEAAAYAMFAGKSLPTAFQWRAAAGFGGFSENFGDILTLSNFGNRGPSAVGSHAGIAPWGAYDMAGNVKEWCWNESADGRLILGGGWNEATYMFNDMDAQAPFHRLATYGFRLARNIEPQPTASYDVVRPLQRNYAAETPVNDAAFALLQSLYRYDPRPLNAKLEQTADTPDWRHETVTIDAAYDKERVIVHVYLPRSSSPPYQSVVFASGGDARLLRSSRDLRLTEVDFVVRSGRAIVFPVYKGTYERIVEYTGMNTARDVTIARGKDVGRVIDYIQSRPDLDHERIGYYGLSLGAFHGVIATAIEPRIKASVLAGAGLVPVRFPPEMDQFNFAPRVRVPTLMINGRDDFTYPLTTAQVPLFRLLGASDHKRHALLAGGHIPDSMHDLMREVLDWFDRYLGPVN